MGLLNRLFGNKEKAKPAIFRDAIYQRLALKEGISIEVPPSYLVLLMLCSLLTFSTNANAWSPRCALKLTLCVTVQGKTIPFSEAQSMVDYCRDFTRNNIGRHVLHMSLQQIHEVSGGEISHPLLKASIAYQMLQDSSLNYDRSVPIEERYFHLRRACAQVFRAMRIPLHNPLQDEDEDD